MAPRRLSTPWILQRFLYSNRSKLEQILATSLRRKNENKKREREEWERFWHCYPRYLGITRRSCLEAHMVLDMEYREQE
jgi:hypothetical protein